MEEKEVLKRFFEELNKFFLGFVLERQRSLFTGPEFQGNTDFYKLFDRAWQEIQSNFYVVQHEIDVASPSQMLRLGLGGAQMELKNGLFLESIYGLNGRYREEVSDGGKEYVKKALGYGKIVLGTAAELLGAAEPIKEMVEVAHEAIDSNIG